jgi:hypothetical protein
VLGTGGSVVWQNCKVPIDVEAVFVVEFSPYSEWLPVHPLVVVCFFNFRFVAYSEVTLLVAVQLLAFCSFRG